METSNGCRALEALRVVWNLAFFPENLRGARERVQKGIVFSDLIKQPSGQPSQERRYVSFRVTPPDPLRMAWNQYRREHGTRNLTHRVEELVNDLFPP